jgi:hypothetical protein
MIALQDQRNVRLPRDLEVLFGGLVGRAAHQVFEFSLRYAPHVIGMLRLEVPPGGIEFVLVSLKFRRIGRLSHHAANQCCLEKALRRWYVGGNQIFAQRNALVDRSVYLDLQ